MSEDSKKVALPAYLLKRIEAFRIGSGGEFSYVLRDKLQSKTYDLDAWQFFILEVLPGCEDYPKLASVFQDRFGRPITEDQLRAFLGDLVDKKVFAAEGAATHPLLKPMLKPGYDVQDGVVKAKPAASAPVPAPGKPKAGGAPATPAGEPEELPPGVDEALGMDSTVPRKFWKLFDPRRMLTWMMPVVRPLRHVLYLAPLMLAAALFIALNYPDKLLADVERLFSATNFGEHILFSLLTVNFVSTLVMALVAHRYRATVHAIGIGLVFLFVPRFMTAMGNTKQLTREERMWLNGAPLLLRVVLLCMGVLVWFNSRDSVALVADIGLALAFVSGIELLMSGNPLLKGSGYQLLCAFLNETKLRGKAFRALWDKLSGGTSYKRSQSNLLAVYGLATFLFMFVVIALILMLLGGWLHGLQIGGIGIVIIVALGLYLLRRTWVYMVRVDEAYKVAEQFDRWRKRAVPEELADEGRDRPKNGPVWGYLKVALLIVFLVILFLPYSYEPGGNFTVYPAQQLQVSTDEPGVITNVYYDGGEYVKKGVVLARLANNDLVAQVRTLEAKMVEQQAHIDDLKARPKPEAVKVAEAEVKTAKNAVVFSVERVARLKDLVKDGAVTQEEYEAARKQAQHDADAVVQREAELALVKTGATAEEIAAAEAQLVSLREQRDMYQSRVTRTVLTMPIDGNILTLHLMKRINSFLDRGQSLASVEDPSTMSAEIEVPESSARYVSVGSTVELRANAFFDKPFEGKVSLIDRNVTVKSFGSVLKVIVLVKNPDGMLRTGMQGYAKMAGVTMPVWKAFSMSVMSFFEVHVWSWIP